MAFDKAAWASGSGGATVENPRSGMVESARNAGLKVGASKTHVRNLLGDPDVAAAKQDLWYLGRNRWSPDYSTLIVNYDEQDIVFSIEEKTT